jgi:hypothetical protein
MEMFDSRNSGAQVPDPVCSSSVLLASFNTMDPPQPSKPKAESTDVFSLTDQDLAEKLKFIEEVPSVLFRVRRTYAIIRLALGTGAVSGYVAPSRPTKMT